MERKDQEIYQVKVEEEESEYRLNQGIIDREIGNGSCSDSQMRSEMQEESQSLREEGKENNLQQRLLIQGQYSEMPENEGRNMQQPQASADANIQMENIPADNIMQIENYLPVNERDELLQEKILRINQDYDQFKQYKEKDFILFPHRLDQFSYALDFSNIYPYQIAYGSCISNAQPERKNQENLEVVQFEKAFENNQMPIQKKYRFRNIVKDSVQMQYPATQIKYAPSSFDRNNNYNLGHPNSSQLFATSSDSLRLYKINQNFLEGQISYDVQFLRDLRNNINTYNLPITSFDWHCDNISTVSIDGSLSVWDLNRQIIQQQTKVNTHQLFDISYHSLGDKILTAGASGSINIHGVNDIYKTNTIYQTKTNQAIIKVQWCPHSMYFAAVQAFNYNPMVFDLRKASTPLYELKGHRDQINCIRWHPRGQIMLFTGSEDGMSMVWDFRLGIYKPKQTLESTYPVLNVAWSQQDPNCLAILYYKTLGMIKLNL